MTEAALFDRAFVRRARVLAVRPEKEGDERFLMELFEACSPLVGLLPPLLMDLQARAQLAGHRHSHPGAMRRIVTYKGEPIARIMVNWHASAASHGVDIAALPRVRHTQVGSHLLRAWLEVADALERVCTLEVLPANRARLLYRRLGFEREAEQSPDDPVWRMMRYPQTGKDRHIDACFPPSA